MTWLVTIDESGNLGHVTDYFVMSAVIAKRVRDLAPVIKAIPRYREESKFYNSTENEIMTILEKLSNTDVHIVAIEVDKHNYKSNYYGKCGNELYRMVLSQLLDNVFKFIGHHDVCVFIDRSTFISLSNLRSIANDCALFYGCNLKRCEKATSQQNKCIQIADYVAGSIFASLEYNDDKFKLIVREKIIPAPKY